MTVDEALKLARDYGVRVALDGNDLALEADSPPPPRIVAILGRGKFDIIAVLRQREAEERHLITQWINDNFTSVASRRLRPLRRRRSGRREIRPAYSSVTIEGDVHASCHAAWLAEREAEASAALGLKVHSLMGHPEPSSSRTGVK